MADEEVNKEAAALTTVRILSVDIICTGEWLACRKNLILLLNEYFSYAMFYLLLGL